jgi:hypothetical protein
MGKFGAIRNVRQEHTAEQIAAQDEHARTAGREAKQSGVRTHDNLSPKNHKENS